jgi:peroxiredoxin
MQNHSTKAKTQWTAQSCHVLIGTDGKVAKIYDVTDAEAHPAEVLDD